MSIPVDGLVIKGSGITSNESAMTGEPEELTKDTEDGCLIKRQERDGDKYKRPKDLPSPVLLSGT